MRPNKTRDALIGLGAGMLAGGIGGALFGIAMRRGRGQDLKDAFSSTEGWKKGVISETVPGLSTFVQ